MSPSAAVAASPSHTDPATSEEQRSGPGNIYLAFIPWVLFGIIDQHDSLAAAAIAALAAAVLVALPGVRRGRPKVLELGAVATFAAFAVVALVATPDVGDWLPRYARAIATGLLALIAYASLLGTPFTEQYARETVDPRAWDSPVFRRVNRSLTLTWALVFTAMVPCHLLAGALDTPRANTIFNWAIPVALVVWAAKRTGRAAAAAGARVPPEAR